MVERLREGYVIDSENLGTHGRFTGRLDVAAPAVVRAEEQLRAVRRRGRLSSGLVYELVSSQQRERSYSAIRTRETYQVPTAAAPATSTVDG
ncbi:hypothetical protein ACIOD2_02080 [Amycolatopsis sp. NPDC088138]|uniref:hypothetical protein n=1 Tax=Amycolatopsis sp. NPDC088138 TaxID=3363938 RepID=UPI0038056DD5